MSLYCAIDLHSNNNVPIVIDEDDHVLYQKRLPNELPKILSELARFKSELLAVAVESTFNWYWLVDGLKDNGYQVVLVNTTAAKQYEGLKYTNDYSDARWLANLMRLKILPTGYIYPPADRAIRDLLRKRMQLVRYRVSNLLSAQNQLWRATGINVPTKAIRNGDYALVDMLDNPYLKMAIATNLKIISTLNTEIVVIEKTVKEKMKLKPEFQSVTTIIGIGDILGLTIMLETGDISRFKKVGNFASYCRCVDSQRFSNGKQKGRNNSKNGNKYLSWAFVEAAHSIIRHNKAAYKFYLKKRAQKNGALATKALAHKLARAAYYVMRDHVPYKNERLFG